MRGGFLSVDLTIKAQPFVKQACCSCLQIRLMDLLNAISPFLKAEGLNNTKAPRLSNPSPSVAQAATPPDRCQALNLLRVEVFPFRSCRWHRHLLEHPELKELQHGPRLHRCGRGGATLLVGFLSSEPCGDNG